MVEVSEIEKLSPNQGLAFVGMNPGRTIVLTLSKTENEYLIQIVDKNGPSTSVKADRHPNTPDDAKTFIEEYMSGIQTFKLPADFAINPHQTATHFISEFKAIWNNTR